MTRAADPITHAPVRCVCRNRPAVIELNVVDPYQRKPLEPDDTNDTNDTSGERRRLARVVHDDRGTARVEWQDVPPDFVVERPKLEVETFDDTVHRLAILNEGQADPFNPYNTGAKPRVAPQAKPKPKRDLRKLSEWIKLMRGMRDKGNDGDDEAG